MNLSKVKLVVSDMDGTLLNSKGEVSDLFFSLFGQLKEQNIIFCDTSFLRIAKNARHQKQQCAKMTKRCAKLTNSAQK